MHVHFRTLASAFGLAWLAACGGGGSDAGSGPVVSTSSFPLRAAVTADVQAGGTVNYGVSGSCAGTATLTDAVPVATTFEGITGYSVLETSTLNLTNCTPSVSTTTTTTYFDTNFAPIGSSTPGEEYSTAQSLPPPLPATVRVGDSDPAYATLTIYTDSSKASAIGTLVLGYAIEADTATTAIAKLVTKQYDTTNRLLYRQEHRYRITTTGTLTSLSLDVQYSLTSTLHLVLTRL